MKLSERWLRQLADPGGDTAALTHQLTMQGLEVEAASPVAPALDGVVVGRVITVDRHASADRLRVCQVDTGHQVIQVVCGAPDVAAGRCYPLALPGAVLNGGVTIKPATLRGVASAGMLCTATELGLGEDDGALFELEPDAVPGTPLAKALELDDRVIDLNITPNRADCFSVLGVARDLAAATGAALHLPRLEPVPPTSSRTFPVRLGDPADCPRFVSRAVSGLRTDARSPLWLKERLRRCGLRSVHPVVDVTNYVMLELGQPLHAYDLGKLQGYLEVRRARPGENLGMLAGGTLDLDADLLVIADGQGPVGLAGIMGGNRTAVAPDTRDILLESAWFSPAVLGGRARRFGLQTEASVRFERGVDPAGQAAALERATRLLQDICGGEPGPTMTSGESVPAGPEVLLRRERLHRLLGLAVPHEEVSAILGRLGVRLAPDPAGWRCRAPSWRFDLSLEVDFIEEIARIHGYERVVEIPGRQSGDLLPVPEQLVPVDRALGRLADRGYQEAITYSFTRADLDGQLAGGQSGAELVNPLSVDLAVMRQSLWPGLLLAVRHNLSRQQRRVLLVESGTKFIPQGSDVKEVRTLAGVGIGPCWPEQWGAPAREMDFFDIKSDVEAVLALTGDPDAFSFQAAAHPALQPGRCARIQRTGQPAGWLGVLHPAIVRTLDLPTAPVLFELDLAVALRAGCRRFQLPSRFPNVRRDLALLVDAGLPVAGLVAAVRELAAPMLQEVVVFDIYTGEHVEAGQKSVALGLILQETSRTLTDEEVDRAIGRVVAGLASRFHARIRE